MSARKLPVLCFFSGGGGLQAGNAPRILIETSRRQVTGNVLDRVEGHTTLLAHIYITIFVLLFEILRNAAAIFFAQGQI